MPGVAQREHRLAALRLLLNCALIVHFPRAGQGSPSRLTPSLTKPLVLPLPLEGSPESPSRRRQRGGSQSLPTVTMAVRLSCATLQETQC